MKYLKKIIWLFLTLLTTFSFGQNVEIKKNSISIDNTEPLKFEKINFSEYSIIDKSGNEIINLQFKDNGTAFESDDYMTIYFVNSKKIIDSSNTGRIAGFGVKNMIKNFITWLLKEKVLNSNGEINDEKIDDFKIKYGK